MGDNSVSSSATTRTPRSRRERPAKPALTRQGIIDAALTLLEREGLNKVTMRRIAAVLDTGPASLYVYVRNTEDLHAQILDALLGSLELHPPSVSSWRERLRVLLTDYVRVLFSYSEIARMTLTTQPSGPNYLSLVDALLGLLSEGGVPDSEAAWAVDLLLLYATANAAEQSTRRTLPDAAEKFSALTAEIAAVDAAVYPNIAKLRSDLLSGGPARFYWGLEVLLSGVLSTRRTDPENDAENDTEKEPS